MYDLKLGRIWLPTLKGDHSLTLGNGLEAVGRAVYGGEDRPRDLKLTLPIRGEHGDDVDPRAIANRLRRQIVALLENDAARLPALPLHWTPFPDRDAWVAIGGGELSDEEPGPTLGEYVLELSDVKRVGTAYTHRQGRRLRYADRRLSTTPRDVLRTLFASDFSTIPSLPLHFLPVSTTDFLGSGRSVLAASVRRALGGDVPVLASRPFDDVVSFEQAAYGEDGADVLIFDRRGVLAPPAPRTNLIVKPSFEDGTTGGYSFSASGGGDPAATLTATRDWAKSGKWSARYVVTRSDSASVTVRNPIGTAATVVTAGQTYGGRLAAFLNRLDGGAGRLLRARIYWYRADGSPSVITVSSDGSLTTPPALGEHAPRVVGVAPADAAFGSLGLVADSDTGYTLDVFVDDFALFALTAGATEADVPAYGDGDKRGWRWTGPPHASPSSTDPQSAGWEEVYGPDQELTAGDVPVLANGLCRVRWIAYTGAAGSGVFAIDVYDRTLTVPDYVERGRFTLYQDQPAGTFTRYVSNTAAEVVSWTPERAVVKVIMRLPSNAQRAELYLTLQRGWTGPRVELYGQRDDGVVPGVLIRYAPASSAGHLALKDGRTNGQTSSVLASEEATWANFDLGDFVSDINPFLSDEPWALLHSTGNGPSHVLSVAQSGNRLVARDDGTAYADGVRKALDVRSPSVSKGYVSAKIDFAAVRFDEAEAIRNVSGTTAAVADAAAIGTAVEDTQATAAAATLTFPFASLPGLGVYGVWARVRVVNATSTGSFRIDTATAGAAVTTTSQTYVWLYLGERTIDATTGNGSTLRVVGWRSGGTGTVRIDRAIALPLERRAAGVASYDGVRDFAQASLADSRQDRVLVSR